MDKEKALQLLGFMQRAGKLVTGESLTVQAVRQKKIKCVVLASDAGPSTTKKVTDKCAYYKVPCVQLFSEMEISQALGKKRTVCGITDKGFADRFHERIKG